MRKVIYYNLLVLFLGVMFLEMSFGNWYSPKQINQLSMPNVLRSYRQTFSVDFYGPKATVVFERDEYGFRGKYSSISELDVITVGGSTTIQKAIPEEQTWQAVMRREFAKEGRVVNIVNAGVSEQSTYGHIKNFDYWFPLIPKLRTRYILFYLGINDFFKDEGYRYDKVKVDKSLKGLIKSRSALYRLYRSARSAYEARIVYKLSPQKLDLSKVEWTAEPLEADHVSLAAKRLSGYERRLRILSEKTQSLGAIPIYVTQAWRLYKKGPNGEILGSKTSFPYDGVRINGVDVYYMMEAFNNVLMDGCGEVGGICINLAAELQFEDSDFYDFVHTTPSGSEKIGKYLYKQLQGIL